VPVLPRGCLGQARDVLDGPQSGDPVGRISAQTWQESKDSPRVRAATGQWSACMRKKGYDYPDPLTAGNDPDFQELNATPAEIATATADMACKTDSRFLQTWYEEEVTAQQRLVQQRGEELRQVQTGLRESVRVAQAVLNNP